ncbi:hypothetical protein IVB45_04885 [Bradyrhizobium sp. 4]|nr:hypothetical protein [Bradyrhizobium sp. 39]MCK1634725.1 hypothetical protein [Bradyrhizobium sp. 162]MCK1749444.1 hypothetical protein [Bradyrhizobium sp. 135]UPJ38641.1 hypothetical protein IVB45_04885 [Bradyrhizobium sp. 4]
MAANAGEVFTSSETIAKIKEPKPPEWTQLRDTKILFTCLHLAPEQAKGLMKSGCTTIAYATVTEAYGGLPPLVLMNEVASRPAINPAGEAPTGYTREARLDNAALGQRLCFPLCSLLRREPPM